MILPPHADLHRNGSTADPTAPAFAVFASDVPVKSPLVRMLHAPSEAPRFAALTSPPQGAMIYQAYQAHSDLLWPLRTVARNALPALQRARDVPGEEMALRKLAAACEVFVLAALTHARPPFRLDTITVGGREVVVREEVALTTPFATLLHFRKDLPHSGPRVLIVTPMSGHFATLLRAT